MDFTECEYMFPSVALSCSLYVLNITSGTFEKGIRVNIFLVTLMFVKHKI